MERPCVLCSLRVFVFPSLFWCTLQGLGWLQARGEHFPPKPAQSSSAYTNKYCTRAHVGHQKHSLRAGFITIKDSPTGIKTDRPFCKQPWTLADLLFVTLSARQNKKRMQLKHLRGLLAHIACKFSAAETHHRASARRATNRKIPPSN